jgi:RimJ/RimL family protein N-acetyltransferase
MSLRLETERLFLRRMQPDDFESHAAMMADPRVGRFLSMDLKPQARSTAWRSFASFLGHWEIRGFGFFSVMDKESGAWVGRVGPWMPEGWPGIECGWGIAPAHWGKGYAPEAAKAAINWIFQQHPDLARIISLIDPSNSNSQVVARKIGETKSQETFKLESFTLDVWSAERRSWLARFG